MGYNSETIENPASNFRRFDSRDDFHASAAAGALQPVKFKGSRHQLCPGVVFLRAEDLQCPNHVNIVPAEGDLERYPFSISRRGQRHRNNKRCDSAAAERVRPVSRSVRSAPSRRASRRWGPSGLQEIGVWFQAGSFTDYSQPNASTSNNPSQLLRSRFIGLLN